MKYRWSEGARFKVAAQIVGERIAKLETEQGSVSAETLVKDAARKNSVLHPIFEWDDVVAANEYRLKQARDLFNHLRVVVIKGESEEAHPMRAYVNIIAEDERGYVATYRALADPDLRAQVLQKALRELDSWRERYRELQELAEIFRVSEEVREKIAVG